MKRIERVLSEGKRQSEADTCGAKGPWASWRRRPEGAHKQTAHLEGQDEDDAWNGGDANQPAPPDGGDDHGGQADDK